MDDGVDAQATGRIVCDGMVATDFTLVEVIGFRNNAQVGRAVAANKVLHTLGSGIAYRVVDSGEWGGVSRAAPQHV